MPCSDRAATGSQFRLVSGGHLPTVSVAWTARRAPTMTVTAMATAACVVLLSAACGSSSRSESSEPSSAATTTTPATTTSNDRGTTLDRLAAVPAATEATRHPSSPGGTGGGAFLTALFRSVQAMWAREFAAAGAHYTPASEAHDLPLLGPHRLRHAGR